MCMIEGSDEACDVWTERKVLRSRKEHKCSECARVIEKGEAYLSIFLVYDGNAETCHICRHCEVGADWLRRNCGGFLVHGIYEDLDDHREIISTLSLRRILWGMRHKWQRGGHLMRLLSAPADYDE